MAGTENNRGPVATLLWSVGKYGRWAAWMLRTKEAEKQRLAAEDRAWKERQEAERQAEEIQEIRAKRVARVLAKAARGANLIPTPDPPVETTPSESRSAKETRAWRENHLEAGREQLIDTLQRIFPRRVGESVEQHRQRLAKVRSTWRPGYTEWLVTGNPSSPPRQARPRSPSTPRTRASSSRRGPTPPRSA